LLHVVAEGGERRGVRGFLPSALVVGCRGLRGFALSRLGELASFSLDRRRCARRVRLSCCVSCGERGGVCDALLLDLRGELSSACSFAFACIGELASLGVERLPRVLRCGNGSGVRGAFTVELRCKRLGLGGLSRVCVDELAPA